MFGGKEATGCDQSFPFLLLRMQLGIGNMFGNELLSTFVVWDKVLTWMSDVHSTRADFKGIEYRPADFCDTHITFL